MKILITGNKGFLGGHLTPFLESKGHTVIGWDIQDSLDIFDSGLELAVSECDLVIHLAAHTNVRYSFEYPEDVHHNNVLGTAIVQEYCYRHAKRLIFASSIATTQRDASPYAMSKALGEDILSHFPDTTVLRFSNLIGNNMNERSGALLYWFLKGSLTGKIQIDGDGTHTRDFIHVRDVMDIILTAIEDDWSGKKVDCATGRYYSVKEIADMFVKHAGVEITYGPAKPGPAKLYGNPALLNELYKKELTTDVHKDIEEMIKDYAKNHQD